LYLCHHVIYTKMKENDKFKKNEISKFKSEPTKQSHPKESSALDSTSHLSQSVKLKEPTRISKKKKKSIIFMIKNCRWRLGTRRTFEISKRIRRMWETMGKNFKRIRFHQGSSSKKSLLTLFRSRSPHMHKNISQEKQNKILLDLKKT
jgi:hypothetical protein